MFYRVWMFINVVLTIIIVFTLFKECGEPGKFF